MRQYGFVALVSARLGLYAVTHVLYFPTGLSREEKRLVAAPPDINFELQH